MNPYDQDRMALHQVDEKWMRTASGKYPSPTKTMTATA
jgi:hypothetical protein